MSRVHEALRKAAQQNSETSSPSEDRVSPESPFAAMVADPPVDSMEDIIAGAAVVPFAPASEALLVNPNQPHEAPGEDEQCDEGIEVNWVRGASNRPPPRQGKVVIDGISTLGSPLIVSEPKNPT